MRRWTVRQLALAAAAGVLWLIAAVAGLLSVWSVAVAAVAALALLGCLLLVETRVTDARIQRKLNVAIRRTEAIHHELEQSAKSWRAARRRVEESNAATLDELGTFKLQQSAILQQLTELNHRSRDLTSESLHSGLAAQADLIDSRLTAQRDHTDEDVRRIEGMLSAAMDDAPTRAQVAGLITDVARLAWEPSREVEASLQLLRQFSPSDIVPASGGWAMSPTGLLMLVQLVRRRRPETIVECGCGTSSVWLGYAVREEGGGHVYSLEHDPSYAQRLREELDRHDLGDWVTVIDAPLVDVDVEGETFQWYSLDDFATVTSIDLLIVDGPPKKIGSMSRFPAVPMLEDRLAPDSLVVLDDAIRPDERQVVKRWRQRNEHIHTERFDAPFQIVLTGAGRPGAA